MNSSYQVQLPVFEGPLDLLLQLIERAELDITSVSLASVTDQYLDYLKRLPEIALDDLASFLVVAARLIQIKSEALLPKPPDREPGEEDPGDALAQQLLIYKRFKQVAGLLEAREAEGLRTFLRLSAPPAPERHLDLEGVDLDALRRAMQEALASMPKHPSLEPAIDPPRIRIRDKMRQVLAALQDDQMLKFKSLMEDARTRLEIVVSFLAVLELIKLRTVRAVQEVPLGEIVLVRGDQWSEHQELDEEFESEE